MNFEIKPVPEEVWKQIKSSNLTVKGYPEMVDNLLFDTGEPTAKLHAEFGVITEAGELADAFKAAHYKQLPLDIENVLEELGDVLFYYTAYRSNWEGRKITSDWLVSYTKRIAPMKMQPTAILNEYLLRKLNRLLDPTSFSMHAYLHILADIGAMYDLTFEQVILYNKYKLIGSKGRYSSGSFSVEAAIERKDKNLQTSKNNL